jgi:hypothetical protein
MKSNLFVAPFAGVCPTKAPIMGHILSIVQIQIAGSSQRLYEKLGLAVLKIGTNDIQLLGL